jgi:hypothetical protein
MTTTTPAVLLLPESGPNGAELPDPGRTPAPGLTWVAPLEARPIALGPSNDHPEVRPALAIDAVAFWTGSRHGLAVGRAELEQDRAAMRFALAPDLRRAQAERADLTRASVARDTAISDYVKDLLS